MTTFSKFLAMACIFAGQLSAASLAGTSSGGGTLGPETQIYCGFNDGQGHELQVNLIGDPSSLGEYTVEVQEATLHGFFAPLSYANVSRMMPSESKLVFKGEGFDLTLDLTTATDIPNQFDGIVHAENIANNVPVKVGCTLNY